MAGRKNPGPPAHEPRFKRPGRAWLDVMDAAISGRETKAYMNDRQSGGVKFVLRLARDCKPIMRCICIIYGAPFSGDLILRMHQVAIQY
jgi:hypothetical protein